MSTDSNTAKRDNLAIVGFKVLAVYRAQFPIEESLADFRKQKESLLSCLQNAKGNPFDRDEAWSEIEYVAIFQRGFDEHRKQTMGASDRNAKLREIADVLTRARKLIDVPPEIASALMDAWGEGTTLEDIIHIYREFPREFEDAIKGLARLQEAAVRAAAETKLKPGRPKETPDSLVIYWLAHIYRSCTGLTPGAGEGPFARFVEAYMSAFGRHIGYQSLVDIIKASRVKARHRHSECTPSPFED
jgi:hypothetical protein